MEEINIVKMPVLQGLLHKFNVVSIQIQIIHRVW